MRYNWPLILKYPLFYLRLLMLTRRAYKEQTR